MLTVSKAPTDGVSNLHFSTDSNHLIASSWDKGLYLYDSKDGKLLQKFELGGPQLDCCFTYNKDEAASVGMDNRVNLVNIAQNKVQSFGNHDDTIRCVKFNKPHNQLLTGSWDRTIRIWDPQSLEFKLISTLQQPDRVYTLSTVENYLVVGTASRHVWIWDLRNTSHPIQKRESSLKHQTRYICCFLNGKGYAHCSIEGRVAVEFFDLNSQSKRYAFKCHRSVKDGVPTIYPINALAFHPVYHTLATGGSDGTVYSWDLCAKRKIQRLENFPQGVSSLAFTGNGDVLAVSSSYTFEEGEKEIKPEDAIFLKKVLPSEFQNY